MRIVRPGGGFGVVLDAEQRQRLCRKPFQRLVVQVHVRQFHFVRIDRVRIDSEVVIVRRDLDLSGHIVAHRVIAAVMAEFELVGLARPAPVPSSWWPRQIPKTGTRPRNCRIARTA